MKFYVLTFLVATAFAVPVPLEDDGGPVELIVNGVSEGEPLELGDVLGIHVNEHVDGVIASSTNLLHPLTAVGMAEAAAAADDSSNVVIPEPIALPPPVAPEVVSPEVVIPEPVVLPSPVVPAPVQLPAAPEPEVSPVIPEPVQLPAAPEPEVVSPVIPEPVQLPAAPEPEVVSPVIPEPVQLPAAPEPEVVSPVIPEPVQLPAAPEPEVVSPVIPEPVQLPAAPEPEVVSPVDVPAAAAQIPNGEVFNNGVVQVSVNTPQEAGVFATLQSWVNLIINYFNEDSQTTQQII